MHNMGRRWAAREVVLLRQLYEAGQGDVSAGIQLGRTPAAISTRRSIIGAVKLSRMKKDSEKKPVQEGPLFNDAFSKVAAKAFCQPLSTRGMGVIGSENGTRAEIPVSFRREIGLCNPGEAGRLEIYIEAGTIHAVSRGLTPRKVAQLCAQLISEIV